MLSFKSKKMLLLLVGTVALIYIWFFMRSSTYNVPIISGIPTSTLNVQTAPITHPKNSTHSNADISPTKMVHRTPYTLYYFYSPYCGYCKNFSGEWDLLVSKLSGHQNFTVSAINATLPQNDDITFYYNINAYPTIILVTPQRNIEYTGDRTAESIYAFIKNQLIN